MNAPSGDTEPVDLSSETRIRSGSEAQAACADVEKCTKQAPNVSARRVRVGRHADRVQAGSGAGEKGLLASTGDRRQNNFDFLRLFAAMLVIYGHAYFFTGFPVPVFAANSVSTVAVKVFFIISGYLVAQSWMNDPCLYRFLVRRSLRIFPALIVVVLCTTFVLGPVLTTVPLGAYFGNPATWNYLSNALLHVTYYLPGLFATNPHSAAVNGSLWTLPAEFAMYLITPLVLRSVGLISTAKAAFVFLAFCIALTSLYLLHSLPQHNAIVIYSLEFWSWLGVAPYFVIGSAYAYCSAERILNVYVAFLGLLGLGVLDASGLSSEGGLMLVLPYVTLSFGASSARALACLSRFGDMSYGVYLYGFVVQQTIIALFGATMGPWANFALAGSASLVLAFVSWHVIEKRALQLKPRARHAVHIATYVNRNRLARTTVPDTVG